MRFVSRAVLRAGSVVVLAACRDVTTPPAREPRCCVETPLAATERPERTSAWAEALTPVEVENGALQRRRLRLYAGTGEIDESARAELERLAARDEEPPHTLAMRLEQLLFKAAYHFKSDRIVLVSGWRARAGRHGTGDAVDFKLRGVSAWSLAAYLRTLPRVGVGIYTHPNTQYVHLDVREPSFHWIDASPPGVTWRERQIWDRRVAERDASWTPESDLP